MRRRPNLPSYKGSKLTYVIIGLLALLEAISTTAQAIFLARAITFLFQGSTVSDVTLEIVYFFIAFMLRQLFSSLQPHTAEIFADLLGKNLRKRLVEAYFHHGQLFSRAYGTGHLVTLAIEGIKHVKDYIELAIPRMIRVFFVPSVIVIYIFTLDKIAAGILIASIPIIILFMILLGLAAQKMADRQYETYQRLANHFIDSLKGLETLAYLGQSMMHGKRINRVNKQYRKATNKTLRIAFLSSFALDFFTSLAIAFVAVSLGFRLIDGFITLLPALSILILAPEYFLPIRQLGNDYHATLDGQIALRNIEQMIDKRSKQQTKQIDHTYMWHPESKITLQNIDVRLDQHTILNDISLTWSGSGAIGIVGLSGAGKSTFIDTLAGFIHPTNGKIFIDHHETNTLKQDAWLEQIAYIPQNPYIFPTTLANNIRFYEPEATDDDVKKIIKQIDLQSFVKTLPRGIHEPIGEGGRTLSGGQEQRIAIARALLSKRPIILFDEPTAHLDIETEYELKRFMLSLFKDKLVFFATHRMHWMNHMDYIIVLENGKLVEEGTLHKLMQRQGIFHHILTTAEHGGI